MNPLAILGAESTERCNTRADDNSIARPAVRIINALQARKCQQSSCHTDGPSYNDKGGDDGHNKAGG